MNSKERLCAALKCQSLDRIPVVPHVFSEPFLRRHFDPAAGENTPLQDGRFNPDLDLVEAQLAAHKRFGFDPLIRLSLRGGPGEWAEWREDWVLYNWESDTWVVSKTAQERHDGREVIEYCIETPRGRLHCAIDYEAGHTSWILEPPIKQEDDILLLHFRPKPAQQPMVSKLNDQLNTIGQSGIGLKIVPGVWHQACELRGATQLFYDVYDRPEWVMRFLGLLEEYLIETVDALGESDLQLVLFDESYVGMGMSPSMYETFVLPYDKSLVEAASSGGLLTIYHNCGLSNTLLELMAATGANAVETLAPKSANGDVDLADAKRRIGHLACLRGGLDTAVLEKGDTDAIAGAVRVCLQAAASGGGYILGPVSPVYDASFENLEFLVQEVKRESPAYLEASALTSS